MNYSVDNNIDSLKEYYIKLQSLYENAVNMLTGINTSLSTTSPQITIDVVDTDDSKTTVRIPSFLYLEGKIEQLENNFNNLFKIPQSGEGWFSKSSDMFKLNLVKASVAPQVPSVISSTDVYETGELQFTYKDIKAKFKDNNFLKDLVSPKTYLTLTLDQLPANIEELCVKKIIIHNTGLFDLINNATGSLEVKTYEDFITKIYGYEKKVDWDEYDSIIKVPLKKDRYSSKFEVVNVVNQWTSKNSNNNYVENYLVEFDTLYYNDKELSSITHTLKEGDKIYIYNTNSQFIIKTVDLSANQVTLEETVGHTQLQKTSENSAIFFSLLDNSLISSDSIGHIEIPLEENQYIILFVAAVYNNVRSEFSNAIMLDLNKVSVYDNNGKRLGDYISYYKEYCSNIGDLIDGIVKTSYPQITDYTFEELRAIKDSDAIKNAVNNTVVPDINIKVVPINKHLSDDKSSEDIKELHNQKNELNSQLQTINASIQDNYSKLISGDFKEDNIIAQKTLQDEINTYYNDRTKLEKQLISVINNISSKVKSLGNTMTSIKYRVRGEAVIDILEDVIKETFNSNGRVNIIGMDVEYKYKSVNKDTTSLTVINDNVFTEWNKLVTIEKERELNFDNGRLNIKFKEFKPTENEIKWNQIDIPITEGEDVILRVRYKLNIGQPFIDIYTDFSDNITIRFPDEYLEEIDTQQIVDANKNDVITAAFQSTLINEGYEEHVQDKLITQDKVFLHNPDSIYSGFNTTENNMLSLREKLNLMLQDIQKYKDFIEEESNSGFEVSLLIDNQKYILNKNVVNTINIYNTTHTNDMFIRKDVQLVIRNTQQSRLKLFSMFPGNSDIPLCIANIKSYNEQLCNYERYPLHTVNKLYPQYLNQWIYFRTTNPYTLESICDVNKIVVDSSNNRTSYQINQDKNDVDTINMSNKKTLSILDSVKNRDALKYTIEPTAYLFSEKQCQLPRVFRENTYIADVTKNLRNVIIALSDMIIKYPLLMFNDFLKQYNSIKSNEPVLFYDDNEETIEKKFTTYIVEELSNNEDSSIQRMLNMIKRYMEADNYVSYNDLENIENREVENGATIVNNVIANLQEILDVFQTGVNSQFEAYLKFNKTNYLPFYIYSNTRYTRTWLEEILKSAYDSNIDNYVNIILAKIPDPEKYDIYSNYFLLKYEDICGKLKNGEEVVYVDSSTNLSTFASTYQIPQFTNNINEEAISSSIFNGAFVYTNIIDNTYISLEENANAKYIETGDSISIPLVFEYFLNTENSSININSIKKSLYFDLKKSLIEGPIHYMVDFVGHNDYTSSADIYTNQNVRDDVAATINSI